MLSLHTNSAALSAQSSISRTQSALSTSQTRLSTGFRVNSAMDDAAGLQIATRLKAQTSGMAMAMRNTQNSISLLQTGEGALDETTTILTRMKDLATQSADASSTDDDRVAQQAEFDALSNELSNIVGNTSFGGTQLFRDTTGTFNAATLSFQIGASSDEKMDVVMSTAVGTMTGSIAAAATQFVSTGAAGAAGAGGTAGTEIATATAANGAITKLADAIDAVGALRSQLGAVANRLDHVYNNLQNISSNTTAATGRIMDTDFAAESSNMTSSQMLLQAGTAMLKQSNSTSSLVMSLLQ
ncbi:MULTISPECIES: flagellin [unclassified Duganella]|jgi:flagellin|uniref:flagellin N-terminal helical domain-containing protein n=1 Tax=unclassified Duganella TaxID=2636909 RepID=UPI00089071BB|nr:MULTISPECIES: flagellin [unclassified Duganella]SDF68969.1 flagellin [Duganella sp. OV458]SDI60355.1 flagellin [Duganella sp. OV510]